MRKIILASNNKHKIIEFKEMFKNCEILTLNDIGFLDDIEENGKTFLENAKIKAEATKKFIDEHNIVGDVIADDSGLCVDALNGEPGIYSARYAGGHGDFEACRKKLLDKLKGKTNKDAYFETVLYEIKSDGTIITANGKTFGQMLEEETGKKDFCYDCIFYSNELKKSFGESTLEEKNSVSHRSRAIKNLLDEENKIENM